jgi:hypothetical protein
MSLALTDFYGSDEGEAGGFSAEAYRAAIREEIMRDRAELEGAPLRAGKGLAFPLAMLAFSLLFSAGALALSLRSYQVEEARAFASPSALYSTESLLIETLKKRSDLDITQRDKLIAEYRQRSKVREDFAQALQAASAPETQAGGPSAPEAGEAKGGTVLLSTAAGAQAEPEAALKALGRGASMDGYYADKLNAALLEVARDLKSSETDTAAHTLEELEATLGKSGNPDSKALQSAKGLAKALAASVAQLRELPKAKDDEGDSVILAMEGARREKVALLGQVLSLEAENTRLAQEAKDTALALGAAGGPAGGALPPADFLGTVSIVEGDKVLVDIAHSALPRDGALVLLFRPSGEGRGSLVAVAKIASFRASTAELSIESRLDGEAAPRPMDAAYMGRP